VGPLPVSERHRVDEGDGAFVRLEVGLEHERALAVPTPRRGADTFGGDPPSTVFFRPEERGEARGRVEAKEAEPVDGAVTPDQRGRLAVADERIVFDSSGHRARQ
jgi:hypothetical protein